MLFILFLAVTALAVPTSRYVQHEKRSSLPRGWQKHDRVSADFKLPMRIALTQSNLEKGYGYLMDVAHPESPNYSRHWTPQQVAEAFAPKTESVDAVWEWLRSTGIAHERISTSQSMGWLHVDVTVREAERLLRTKYHLHRHESGLSHVACDSYHLPDNLKEHVDFITPTVHFDTKVGQAVQKRQATKTAAAGVPVKTKAALEITKPYNGFTPKKGAEIDINGILDELKQCDSAITPDCLRALYRFPPGITANPRNSFGVTAYSPYAYSQNDLDLFFDRFSTRQRQRTPSEQLIDGGVARREDASFVYLSEPDLDLEYSMTLVNPQNVTLYQTGDLIEGASFNNFLDALDASYCTTAGGDDPIQDAIYPDTAADGYRGPRACGGFAATKVISTSYGYNEADLTPAYEARQCNEYMKLGLQGTSFFFSSGDSGVAGTFEQCITPTNGTNSTNPTNDTSTYNDGTSGKFNPAFPSTCPYVTSVGATEIPPGGSVFQPERACQSVILSGGGFSNVFSLPSYQSSAVLSYFRNSPPPYGADRFNNSKATRGYPDISANGANFVTFVAGISQLIYGTSASTPVVSSIFTLINEARAAIGKRSVGFVNPTLYAHPEDLNDVVEGGNAGCGTAGFESVKGWDPVTGLGTPNFPRLLARFLALP